MNQVLNVIKFQALQPATLIDDGGCVVFSAPFIYGVTAGQTVVVFFIALSGEGVAFDFEISADDLNKPIEQQIKKSELPKGSLTVDYGAHVEHKGVFRSAVTTYVNE